MKKTLAIIIVCFAIFGTAMLAFAAPVAPLYRSIIPETDNTYYIGTTTPSNLRYNGNFNNLTISGTCTGCGGGSTYAATYPVTLTGSNFGLAFGTTTANTWSQLQTFGAGFISNASSTIKSTLTLSPLATPAGTFLAANANGTIIATTTPSGGSTNYWTLTGNDIYNNNSGSVGIGTMTPGSRLEADGVIDTISAPSGFSATLEPETLVSPGSDSLSFLYGPTPSSSGSGNSNIAETGYTGTVGGVTNYSLYSYLVINGTQYTSPTATSIYVSNPATAQDNGSDNGSAENASYTGYTNNDTVSATVYSYRSISGIQYLSPSGFGISPIVLSNNPSGIDWIWNQDTNSDSSNPDGYWICINDQTLSTNNCFDVGNVLTYADNNSSGAIAAPTPIGIPYGNDVTWSAATTGDGSTPVDGYILENVTAGTSIDVGNTTSYSDTGFGGTVSLNPFSGFLSIGQAFSFDLFAASISPSGNAYYNDNGNGYSINTTEPYSNGTQFWVVHTVSSTAGNAWRELENDAYGAGNGFDGPHDQTFYQTSGYSGTSTVTPSRYGIVSDGTTLTRNYEAFSQRISPSILYSFNHTDSGTTDPNDSQYYYFKYQQTNSSDGVRVLESINGSGYADGEDNTGGTGTFYQDALSGAFNGPATVTPNSLATTAIIASSTAASALDPANIIVDSSSATPAPSISFTDGVFNQFFKIGYDPSYTTPYLSSPTGNFVLREGATDLAHFYSTSDEFNVNGNSSYTFSIGSSGIAAEVSIVPTSASNLFAIGGNLSTSEFIVTSTNVGVASGTPGSLFSIGSTNGINFSTATSTFSSTGGINLTNGCFAVKGVCVGGSSGGITAIGPIGKTQTGPTVTFATSSTSFNGLTASTTITAAANLITFSNTLAGVLGVGAGGLGNTSFASSTIPIFDGIKFVGYATSSLGLGTVTNILANNGLTGGTITTTGTVGIDSTLLSANGLVMWNGSKLVATGTPQLTVGYLTATSSSASTFTGSVGIGTSTPFAKLSIQTNSSSAYPFALATSSTRTLFAIDPVGNQISDGDIPTLSSCGTSPSVIGDNTQGIITTGSGISVTACTLTFADGGYPSNANAVCTISTNSLVALGDVSSLSNTSATFGLSASLASGNIYYHCGATQ